MENQPKPFFDKIVGKDPEFRESVANMLTKQFREQHLGSNHIKELLQFEIPKTNEQYQIIQVINQVTDELLAAYEMQPHEVPPANIHLVEANNVTENIDAGFSPQGQMIILGERAHKDDIIFAASLLHETIHAKGHNALRLVEDETGNPVALNPHRSGFQVGAKGFEEKQYLKNFDEALTEMLTMRLLPKVIDTPVLKEQVKKQNEIKDNLRSKYKQGFLDDCYYFKLDASGELEDFEPHSYPVARQAMQVLIEKLLASGTTNFKNTQEIEDFLYKAKIKGHLVETASMIDKAFGDGTFKQMAEVDTDPYQPEQFKSFIESL